MHKRFLLPLFFTLLLGCFACAEGEQLELPAGTRHIEESAFRDCVQISEVILPDGLEAIGSYAFFGSSVNRVDIPDSVVTIGSEAFPAGTLITSSEDAYAHGWALENGYPWESNTVLTSRYYALIIGQRYSDTPGLAELKACYHDARSLQTLLGSMSATPYQVTMLYNATSSEILNAVHSTFSGAQAGDVCLFYYSGHGNYSASNPAANGALIGSDGALVTIGSLRSALDATPAEKIVIMDSCYSGAFLENSSGTAFASQSTVDLAAIDAAIIRTFALSSRSAQSGSYHVMTAARYNEMSYEATGTGENYGVFTYCLLKGSGYSERTDAWLDYMAADTDRDAMITQNEGFTYAYNETVNIYESADFYPHPHAQVFPAGSDFCLWGRLQ